MAVLRATSATLLMLAACCDGLTVKDGESLEAGWPQQGGTCRSNDAAGREGYHQGKKGGGTDCDIGVWVFSCVYVLAGQSGSQWRPRNMDFRGSCSRAPLCLL